MIAPTTSIKLFSSLSRAPGAVWTEATERKAPHKPLLREQSILNREAFDYSKLLEEKAHLPLVKEIVEAGNYRPAACDQGFPDSRYAACSLRSRTRRTTCQMHLQE